MLVAIIIPALSKARRQAMSTQYLSNQRQMGIALQMYVNENKGWLPQMVVSAGSGALHQYGEETVYERFPSFRAKDFGLTNGPGTTGSPDDTQKAPSTRIYRARFDS